MDPLVPVTVTVKVPAGPLQDNVEVWDAPRTMLVGLRLQLKPDGETEEVKSTVPVNPFRGATVTMDVPESPARIWLGLTGPAEMEKSGTTTTVK